MEENNEQTRGVLSDMERLLRGVEAMGLGSFETMFFLEPSDFEDQSIAKRFNFALNEYIKRNNHYLARINDAELRIGDMNCLKSLFEEVIAQQGILTSLLNSKEETELKGRTTDEAKTEFLALSQQVANSFPPFMNEMRDSERKLDELISYKGRDLDDEFWDKLSQVKKQVNQSENRVSGLERRISDMTQDARDVYSVIDKRTEKSDEFLSGIEMLNAGYKNLTGRCVEMGKVMNANSRCIDEARNDFYRHNSKPTVHDCLNVFKVDHHTLVWRLYTNIMEFENLKLTQINNPTSCKLGVWAGKVDDPSIANSLPFKKVLTVHNALHAKAVDCFEAKKNARTRLALDYFLEAKTLLQLFDSALDDLHDFYRGLGYDDETDI